MPQKLLAFELVSCFPVKFIGLRLCGVTIAEKDITKYELTLKFYGTRPTLFLYFPPPVCLAIYLNTNYISVFLSIIAAQNIVKLKFIQREPYLDPSLLAHHNSP